MNICIIGLVHLPILVNCHISNTDEAKAYLTRSDCMTGVSIKEVFSM